MTKKTSKQIAKERIFRATQLGETSLSLRSLGLDEVPSEIFNLTSLTMLSLAGNNLLFLPSEIGKLTNLTVLVLSNNQLTALPSEIGKLTRLKRFYLSNNKLNTLPPEFKNFTQLTKLELSANNFSVFPPELISLKGLRHLSFGGEVEDTSKERGPDYQSDVFFEPFTSMAKYKEKNIQGKNFNHNNLSQLPTEIGDFRNLETLKVKYNKLQKLPIELRKLQNLKYLALQGNPDLPIPPEILEKAHDPAAILAAYFDVRRPLHEAKVILVGQPNVGKTSLVKRIVENQFNQDERKTAGIRISRWPVNRKPSISLNIWDFGGQEIMHATHQFFLTKRSLYLLVVSNRESPEQNRIEYWLKMIQSYGGDSPIIVVGNKLDEQSLDVNRIALQKKYPNIKVFLETSCLDGHGIEQLREVIANEISTLPHVRDELPESWFQVKEKLENIDRDFIPYSEYEKLCYEGDIKDEKSQSTLISFLHDLGTALNFRDTPRLQETNIINPKWVTNGVYRILNSNELFQKKGVLEIKQLGEMLDPKTYPKSHHMFIVDIMRKFELCYPFEGDAGKYLVPDLLPREEPFTGDWADGLAFEFHYGVLPGSIISRFIVRMHPFIHQHTVWRAGVVLKSGNNFSLIHADYEDKKIFIRVKGKRETRRDALTMVRSTLEDIHETITGLDAAPKVPHPAYPELILDYDELIEFENQGISSFPRTVGSTVVMVDVKNLLDGIEEKFAPQVFISYAHKDKKFTTKLTQSLEKAGIRVWKDTQHLQGGDKWHKAIATGITQSKLVLNVLSPDSIESDFVEKEIIFAASNAKKKIIPLRIKDVKPPLMLANLQYVNFFRNNYEKTFEELLNLIQYNL